MSTAALILSAVAIVLSTVSLAIHVRTRPPKPQRCLDCQTMQGDEHSPWCQYAPRPTAHPSTTDPSITMWIDETLDFKLTPHQRAFVNQWMSNGSKPSLSSWTNAQDHVAQSNESTIANDQSNTRSNDHTG